MDDQRRQETASIMPKLLGTSHMNGPLPRPMDQNRRRFSNVCRVLTRSSCVGRSNYIAIYRPPAFAAKVMAAKTAESLPYPQGNHFCQHSASEAWDDSESRAEDQRPPLPDDIYAIFYSASGPMSCPNAVQFPPHDLGQRKD